LDRAGHLSGCTSFTATKNSFGRQSAKCDAGAAIVRNVMDKTGEGHMVGIRLIRIVHYIFTRSRAVVVSTIRSLSLLVIVCMITYATWGLKDMAYAGEWLKSDPQSKTWVDTSHWVDKIEWVDTSHWETSIQDVWVSSGYWDWTTEYYWTYRLQVLRYDSGVQYVSREGQIGWSYVQEYGEDRISVFNVTYYFEAIGRYRAEWDAAIYKKIWYQESYSKSYWVDTSHWESQAIKEWIASGQWETHQEWVGSGYWAEPLHGRITIAKTPTFIFTKWHWLTQDGTWHSYIDERANVRISVSWTAERPVAGVSHYANITRFDDSSSVDHLIIAVHNLTDYQTSGEMQTVTEYEHAGTAKHTIELRAQDGAVARIDFEIPVNGFNGVNVDEERESGIESEFLYSSRDLETIGF